MITRVDEIILYNYCITEHFVFIKIQLKQCYLNLYQLILTYKKILSFFIFFIIYNQQSFFNTFIHRLKYLKLLLLLIQRTLKLRKGNALECKRKRTWDEWLTNFRALSYYSEWVSDTLRPISFASLKYSFIQRLYLHNLLKRFNFRKNVRVAISGLKSLKN